VTASEDKKSLGEERLVLVSSCLVPFAVFSTINPIRCRRWSLWQPRRTRSRWVRNGWCWSPHALYPLLSSAPYPTTRRISATTGTYSCVNPLPDFLDKKGGRDGAIVYRYLTKDGIFFPPFLSNEPGACLPWPKFTNLKVKLISFGQHDFTVQLFVLDQHIFVYCCLFLFQFCVSSCWGSPDSCRSGSGILNGSDYYGPTTL
jgi:hypothetical protein